MSKYRPVSPRMRRAFEKAGCRFTERRYNLNTGEEQADGGLVMHPVYAKDGSYVGDALDGRHFRFLARHGIFEPMLATPDGRTAAIGRATKGEHAGKWVGWSHRARCAFGIGSTVKQGDCAFMPSCQAEMKEDLIRWHSSDTHRNLEVVEDEQDGQKGFAYTYEFQYLAGPRKSEWGKRTGFEPFPPWGRGEWTAETDEDAKQMAIDFANSVS